MYWPLKYYKGLSTRKATQRKNDVKRRLNMSWKNPQAYKPFLTDKHVKTRRSKYIQRFPQGMSLNDYSKTTGVPLRLIKQCYNRGMAAWRTGHRPGATQQQWGYARVASMITCGKTYYTTDSDLVREANKKTNWFKKTCKTNFKKSK